MGTQFRFGHIDGVSLSRRNPEALSLGEFDVLICAASWDDRCSWLIDSSTLRATLGIIVTYEHEDPEGRQRANLAALDNFITSRCLNKEQVRGSSGQIKQLWHVLWNKIIPQVSILTRPVRICLDITAIPRYCTLALFAKLLGGGMADCITFIYAEGLYPERQNGSRVEFHIGKWSKIEVEGLVVPYNLALDKFMLVSVGFEGTSTMRVVSEEEPSRIAILFPSPGVRPEYEQRTREENAQLIREYCVPEKMIAKARAGDAIAAWRSLNRSDIERPIRENTLYLCCGTRPHALALGLHALSTRMGTILYYIPDSHAPNNIISNGRYWRYDVTDLTALPRRPIRQSDAEADGE